MDKAFQRIALAAAVAVSAVEGPAHAQDRYSGNSVLPFAEEVLGPGVFDRPSLAESAAIGARLGRHGYDRFIDAMLDLREETDQQCARVRENPERILDATVDLRAEITDFSYFSRARAMNALYQMDLRRCIGPSSPGEEKK